MRLHSKRHFFRLWVLGAAGLLTACGEREPLAVVAAREKILLKGNGTEPRALDPHLVQSTTEHHVLMGLFEGLTEEHPTKDDQVIPGVAERWEMLEGGRRWIFHLRADAKWSDGHPLTAQDFVWSYHRELNPNMGALYADMLFKLKNAEEFYLKKINDPNEIGVKALDERTLELALTGPMPYLPTVLTHFTWFPLPRHCIEQFGKSEDRFNQWTREGNMVSNGAFRLKRWRFKQEIEMERNPYYWDAKNVKLNGVRFFPIEDSATEDRMFRDGRLHLTETVPLSRIPYYKAKHPDIFYIRPYLGVYFYRINITRPQLQNRAVRQALSLAIDRQILCERVLQGGQVPATGLTPPMPGYHTPVTVRHDPDAARKLLTEAGFPDGKGFPRFTIHVNDVEAHRTLAEAIQEMWRKELGIEVGIRTEDSSVFYDTQNRMDYDVSRAGWIADFVHPITFIDMWTKGNQNNNTGYDNPQFDQMVKDAIAAESEDQRLRILEKAEQFFMDECAAIPIYWYTRQFLMHPSLKGWEPKMLDNHPYKFLDLEEAAQPVIR